ncbi:relaxase domain-containing protein [Streptomyces sp. NBC_01724]|uniref:relaxase domain-containing protein n=1 Tax=unclassified Streptomyces TaxID=2593676 RepID=UPI002E365588|nr:relaxase domain-containing protein [Streptomyces sp. NBC_01724]WTE56763.1 relaxase domain-containing protein [Streptomyces sp. NBC_01620]
MDEAQEEAGVPPGVWMARALPAVGLVAGEQVTEGQMRNLTRIVADRLAVGDSPAAAARAARLGYRVQKCSGNDLVFRPPGTVQALWSLGTPPVRQFIEDLQTRVTGKVLATAETEHLWVRVGGDSTVLCSRPHGPPRHPGPPPLRRGHFRQVPHVQVLVGLLGVRV